MYYSKDGKLTLDDVVEYSRTYNNVCDGRKQEKEQAKAVDAVGTYDNRSKTRPDTKEDSKVSLKKCNFCGRNHAPRKCPAYGKTCYKCKNLNHFANVCKKDSKNKVDAISDSVKFCEDGKDDECLGAQAFLGEVATKMSNRGGAMRVAMKIGSSSPVSFKVDTGADVTIINLDTYHSIKAVNKYLKLEKPDRKLGSPAGRVKVIGMICEKLSHNDRTIFERMYVLDRESKSENLLSRGASVELQIISFLGSVEAKDSLFGFGRWKIDPVKLSLAEDAVPCRVRSARSVAIPLLPAVKANLSNLVENDLIEKVSLLIPQTGLAQWCL